eukprot:CAMPEP_0119110590 /NCGR_PEP_ID=MMETSP1180-20130426/30643_1 /TAXON_ID=3052 ORGANISM="Chlamydomonas cf sp, Strain CCMP681" /NCGR_SAMPLE_ID=MMETSP1180 /ASSEMBLY_ACC=CAM_ASM_000741 /LENGTH=62 /DNA_ID=CAMNT_0007097015 /DNA_START=1 /DNA_END=189 /DNA_ORIENTATION=+
MGCGSSAATSTEALVVPGPTAEHLALPAALIPEPVTAVKRCFKKRADSVHPHALPRRPAQQT